MTQYTIKVSIIEIDDDGNMTTDPEWEWDTTSLCTDSTGIACEALDAALDTASSVLRNYLSPEEHNLSSLDGESAI